MGLSVLVAPGVDAITATVEWGDYSFEGEESTEDGEQPSVTARVTMDKVGSGDVNSTDVTTTQAKRGWRRTPQTATIVINVKHSQRKPKEFVVPDSNGLRLVVIVRPVSPAVTATRRLPDGARSVSVFLVNWRIPEPDHNEAFRTFAFQTHLRLESPQPFVARPDLRGAVAGHISDEWDERVADLQYRDAFEYTVGHGVSAKAQRTPEGECMAVETTWLPQAEVERVAPASIPDVELGMEALGDLQDGAVAAAKMLPLVAHYRQWITDQQQAYQALTGQRGQTRDEMLQYARHAAARIETGIRLLEDPQILQAFCTANRAMARAARQREWIKHDRRGTPEQLPAPTWFPFQLAFILMTLQSITDPTHGDREAVDLLFFPTGGGKTEAYLGLAAFAIVLRRLRNPGVRGCGLSVLMRYTLRLLTLDQLGRAAGLMCALELEREQNEVQLGTWPFEIGLWVGQAATPNRMGGRGYNGPGKEYTAYIKTMRFQRDEQSNPAPIPLEECPWCGTKFTRYSFRLSPNEQKPLDLHVHCINPSCLFKGDRPLPIVGVDEPIYRRLPAFIIATVDKFASLPWTGETGALFGRVDRYDKDGFYGPCQPNKGAPLGGGHLPPPDLIIQDELHLISGPLGTIAGVYEAAIDALASRTENGRTVRPKIIASTATVRRADTQIKALFERHQVMIFPPPSPDRRDSFFAHTQPSSQTPARLYVGVAAQGRSIKVLQLRASLALMSAAQVAYVREGGKKNKANPADPYMTLLAYFNSLRELGGSRRIVEDEVRTRLGQYAMRKRIEPVDELFTDRTISYDVLELTSRVSTGDVAGAKRRLALPFHEIEYVDTALATNMISVGLDIVRLGLMVVLGQPKMSAEYIQATSRVGRDPGRPGLVVSSRFSTCTNRVTARIMSVLRPITPRSIAPWKQPASRPLRPVRWIAPCLLCWSDCVGRSGLNSRRHWGQSAS